MPLISSGAVGQKGLVFFNSSQVCFAAVRGVTARRPGKALILPRVASETGEFLASTRLVVGVR
jgi:hypothetical protein